MKIKLKLLIAAVKFKLTGRVQIVVIDKNTHASIGTMYPIPKYWAWRISKSKYQPLGQFTLFYHKKPPIPVCSFKHDRKGTKEFLSKF